VVPSENKGRNDFVANGKHFDELEVDQKFIHAVRRTITESDNVLFSHMTMNPQPLHLDFDYCAEKHGGDGSKFGGRVLNNSFMTLATTVGISIWEATHGTTVANLGMREVEFPAPVFHGDTLNVETTVLDLIPSKSNPTQGVAVLLHQGFNQHGTLVCKCVRKVMLKKQTAAAAATSAA